MDQAIPTNTQALVAIAIIAVATPQVVAFLTRPGAPAWLTGILSGLVTGAGAVSAYLFDVKGVPDWPHVFGLFVIAVAATQGFRKGIDPGIENAVTTSTAGFGLTATAGVTNPRNP